MATQTWIVEGDDEGLRLDKYLAHPNRLQSRARAVAALERGKVFRNDQEAGLGDAAARLAAGDRIHVWMDRPGSAQAKRRSASTFGDIAILYEDEALLVVNKPAGLLSVPLERNNQPSVYDRLEDRFRSHGKRRPFVVHRIDQDTSGLVVFANDAASQGRLKEQFKRREPDRIYLAVVYGHPDPGAGRWTDRLVWDDKALIQKETHPNDPRGTTAISDYRTIERFRETSLIEVALVTGRRNQIRLQARLRGHTLVGEQRYTYGPDALRPIQFERHALHAWRLGFDHPADGERVEFEAPLPADFNDLLQRLRGRT